MGIEKSWKEHKVEERLSSFPYSPCFPNLPHLPWNLLTGMIYIWELPPQTSGGHAYWFLTVKEGHSRVKWGFLGCSTHPRDWHQVLPGNFEDLESSKRKASTTINQQNCIARIQLKPQLRKKRPQRFYSLKPMLWPFCNIMSGTPCFCFLDNN